MVRRLKYESSVIWFRLLKDMGFYFSFSTATAGWEIGSGKVEEEAVPYLIEPQGW